MGDAIVYLFLKPDTDYVVPDEFGLCDAAANLDVKAALVAYTTAAKKAASEHDINSFHERLAAFQNAEVESNDERNYYDDCFGWMNPKNFDKAGNVLRNP